MLLGLPQLLAWGLRSNGVCQCGCWNFHCPWPYTYLVSLYNLSHGITMALSKTWVTVVSFHDLVLASVFTLYITGSSSDGREPLAFIGNLLFNCPAMNAFLLAKISQVSLLGSTGEILHKVVLNG